MSSNVSAQKKNTINYVRTKIKPKKYLSTNIKHLRTKKNKRKGLRTFFYFAVFAKISPHKRKQKKNFSTFVNVVWYLSTNELNSSSFLDIKVSMESSYVSSDWSYIVPALRTDELKPEKCTEVTSVCTVRI